MVRLSQGDEQEEKPTIQIVDGRSERVREIDSQIATHAARWFQAHDAGEPRVPSELVRKHGILLEKKYGIAVCTWRPNVRRRPSRFVPNSSAEICGYLILIRNGEKLPRCRYGHRRWIKQDEIIFQHNNPGVVKTVISSIMGWKGRNKKIYRLPTSRMNEWARRAEVRLDAKDSMLAFYSNMPWNIPNFGGVK